MRIRPLMFSVLLVQLVFVLGAAIVLVRLGEAQDTIIRSQEQVAASRSLAAELRQSSDDLTRFARTFAVTGDRRYRRYFDLVLAIRNGEIARPSGYEGPYWDAVIAGDLPEPTDTAGAVSLRRRMEEAGFTPEDLGLLETAQARSDALVAMEQRAFAAMERYLQSGDPADMALAQELVHGVEYHAQKGAIMAPIGDFERAVRLRTSRDLGQANATAAWYRTILLALTSAMFVLLAAATWVIQRRIVGRAGQLAAAARDIEAGELGVRSGVTGNDELGELARAFDAMVEELGGALGSARRDSARSQSLLEALVGANPDGVIEVYADTGVVRSFNRSAREMLGEALVPGVAFDELAVGPGSGYTAIEGLAADCTTEERDLRGSDGGAVRVEMRTMIVEDAGERVALLVIRDITKWRRELDARYEEILRLSSPVIELEDGVLLVPVVGELTSQRAARLTSAVLDAIQRRDSRFCIIDIRGITSMDADIGIHLVRIVSAAKLMGCDSVLSGLSPDTVQKMCAADLPLERVQTVASLRQAIALIRRRMTDERRRGLVG